MTILDGIKLGLGMIVANSIVQIGVMILSSLFLRG